MLLTTPATSSYADDVGQATFAWQKQAEGTISRAFVGRFLGSRPRAADFVRREPVRCHRSSPLPERWLLSGPRLPPKESPPIPARTRLSVQASSEPPPGPMPP